ncbi:hypothetical protein DSECCO2_283210 [anaerobic digester metagenome]
MKIKNYLLVSIILIIINGINAQTHYADWIKTIESSIHGNTNINNVLHDGNDLIVNGTYLSGEANFSGEILPGGIGSNSVIAKLTTEGSLLWTTTMTSDNYGGFFDMALDKDKNIVLSGWNTSLDTLKVNGEPVIINNGQWLTFGIVMKISGEDGSLIWFRYMTSTEYTYLNPTKISIDENEEIFVTGYYNCPFQIDQISFPYNHEWGDNMFFLKLDQEGNAIWGSYLTAADNGAWGSIRSIESNEEALYCSFEYYSPYLVNGEPLPHTGENYWLTLLKVSKVNGEIIAVNPFGGPGAQSIRDIALDASGNIVAVGYFQADTPLTIGDITLQGIGGDDGFIFKCDGDLSFLWAKSLGGEYTDQAFNVTTDANNRIYIGGGFDCFTDFLYDGISVLPSRIPNSLSNFLVVTDNNGQFLNSAGLYGEGIETIISFASATVPGVRENVAIYCVGNFYDYVEFAEGEMLFGEHNTGYIYKWNLDVVSGSDNIDTHNKTFRVYPNPFSDLINVNLAGKSAKIEVFNAFGSVVASGEIKDSGSISLSQVESGTYFIRLTKENSVQTIKMIKH